ncbi:FAD/NAD(P)-binding protein [Streptomyces castrisilvae]|uniref:FAD/NAD(P)-binding protein n=1 Tax=Streptomyces castrisilvae TaxID=3033811 RepID=A0ABY9HN72_9ACTN|nr:FAD/NAD(P)-binding protein [Streptomyces sp. Mut1]WLQ35987.1 FAD/NAD(P)-binding protein [Streptomyces sp. Mut1]
MTEGIPADLNAHVARAAEDGRLVVQPRMGMALPGDMAAGLRAVADSQVRAVGTITLDSYTRVGDHAGARRALDEGLPLNGFPLVAHGPEITRSVAGAAGDLPVQVRHGSAQPADIFAAMAAAGLTTSEGGPVSYCLPYGRTPLAESVASWRDAGTRLAEECRAQGLGAHLETFGGCLLGQLCPPSLLVAMSVLEGLFFARCGIPSVSLSYAQQTSPVQDIEALAAMRILADELLPPWVERHIVLYAYMGVFPRSLQGAELLQATSAEVAVRGGAGRLIVKTSVEAHRIPSVEENLAALRLADATARHARHESVLPWHGQADPTDILREARALMAPVLEAGDIGEGLLHAFREGLLDVPYCLHVDNKGLTQGAIGPDGRLEWARTGALPLPGGRPARGSLASHELLHMLNHTADRYDRQALLSGHEEKAVTHDTTPLSAAIVGAGPRGLAVLERLVARAAADEGGREVRLHVIDDHEPGAGRIWRTDQPRTLLMNTPAGEVTMFSGPCDDGPARAGAGPSLGEWWQRAHPDEGDPLGYAPRAVYGEYLRFVLDAVVTGAPAHVRVSCLTDRVVDLCAEGPGGRWLVRPRSADVLTVERVALTTGHSVPELLPEQRVLADFADERPHLRYVRGDSAADMALDDVPPTATVGVLGLGLAFYDVMSLLTEGRGGRYEEAGDGALRYVPSGREPGIVAGSRSGVPLPARGRNQKSPDHSYRARIFTRERVRALTASGKLDFERQVLPWIMAEVNLVYFETLIRGEQGPQAAAVFVTEATRAASMDAAPEFAVARRARRFGVKDPGVDLFAWARPFRDEVFDGPDGYRKRLTELIEDDLAHAARGNHDGPVKAALDTLRDVRSTIRLAVDLGGLTACSHELDFLGRFVPVSSHLAAGPPRKRLQQVLALMEAGVLRILGPGAEFRTDAGNGTFVAASRQVTGSEVPVEVVVDARIPTTDIRRDSGPLITALRERGLATSYANVDDEAVFDTGGLSVTSAPYHPVDAHGQPVAGLYALGIPTEHARWFTQVGSSRPGPWGEFMADADAIAQDMLAQRRVPQLTCLEAQ